MKITNYDVLIESSEDEGFRLAHENHVGNKRFEVFLNLHKAAYLQAKQNGDNAECEVIVSKIVDIVCHKCVPHGRFLERVQDETDQWLELGEGRLARDKIHQALRASGSTTHRSSKVFTNTQTENPKQSEEAAIKRRRRGSYARLRRSISESMLFNNTTSSSGQQEQEQQEQPHEEGNHLDLAGLLKSQDDDGGDNVEPFEDVEIEMKPMDVILNPNRRTLAKTSNPGNARFNVLMQVQAGGFSSSNKEKQKSIVDDLINTIHNHWQGRILVQNLLGYEKLSGREAAEALRMVLLHSAKPPIRKEEEEPPLQTNVPFLATETFGPAAFDASVLDHFQQRARIQQVPLMHPATMIPIIVPSNANPMVPIVTPMNSLVPTDWGPPPSTTLPNPSDIDNLRSAAVQGLKARKQKRAIMERIGKTK